MKAFILIVALSGLLPSVHCALAAGAPSPSSLMDFSTAGYGGGGVPLPNVPARLALSPSGDDDTLAIQGALDALGKLPLDAQGFRGAVVLRPGSYLIQGQLHLTCSGVVLRGDRATLLATGTSRRTLIEIHGHDDRVVGEGVRVTGDTVAAGSRSLTVASVERFAVGSRVLVRRPSTKEWIDAVGANNFPGPGQYKDARLDWIPGSRDIEWARRVTAVDAAAHQITFDAPITTALEAKFGGATIHLLSWPGVVRQVGVEGLTCVAEVNSAQPLDENHAWMCVSVDLAEDVWVRDVIAQQFVSSCVWVANRARAVTVEDCISSQPASEIGGWRRVSFYVGGGQILVQRCRAEDGWRDFVAGHCSPGPNVFLDCQTLRANANSGPFESWASGVLYDQVSIQGAGLALANLGAKTQGAAWTAANCVLWNCAAASRIDVDDPPGAPNRVVVDEATPSLYRTQLAARVGASAVATLRDVPLLRDAASATSYLPVSIASAAPAPKLLSLINGYFVVDGRAIFGTDMNSALWKGQLIPGREREVGTSPTRWAPGRTGPGRTEDLNALTDTMVTRRAAFYYAFPGLWYDRRRDEHSIVRREDSEVAAPFFESPWARSGQGRAWDGLSKYDLTKFNPWYFARLRELADDCATKGLVLVYQLYDNHNVEEAAAHWAEFAWRPANALQDTGFPEPPAWEGATQSRHHIADQFYDVTNPVRRPLHVLYINHVLDVLADAPNVVFTLGYQFAGPLVFQQFFIDTVAAWEKSHRRHVMLQLQTSKAVTDAVLADPPRAEHIDIIDTRYWQYLPDCTLFAPDGQGKQAFRELRTDKFGRDAVMASKPELVYKQVREYRDRFPGKAILTSHAGFGPIPILMAGGASPVQAESTPSRNGGPHDDTALLKFVAENVADVLSQMKPVDDLVNDGWCLTNNADCWLLYTAGGSTIQLQRPINLVGAQARWFNPSNGKTTSATLGDNLKITKPSNEAWLLLLRNH